MLDPGWGVPSVLARSLWPRVSRKHRSREVDILPCQTLWVFYNRTRKDLKDTSLDMLIDGSEQCQDGEFRIYEVTTSAHRRHDVGSSSQHMAGLMSTTFPRRHFNRGQKYPEPITEIDGRHNRSQIQSLSSKARLIKSRHIRACSAAQGGNEKNKRKSERPGKDAHFCPARTAHKETTTKAAARVPEQTRLYQSKQVIKRT